MAEVYFQIVATWRAGSKGIAARMAIDAPVSEGIAASYMLYAEEGPEAAVEFMEMIEAQEEARDQSSEVFKRYRCHNCTLRRQKWIEDYGGEELPPKPAKRTD